MPRFSPKVSKGVTIAISWKKNCVLWKSQATPCWFFEPHQQKHVNSARYLTGYTFQKKSMMPWWERFFPWLRRHVNSTWIWRMGIFGLFLTFCHYRQRLNLAGCKEVEVKLRVVGALARNDWWKKGLWFMGELFWFQEVYACNVHGSYYFDDTFYMVSLHVSPTL